MFRGHFSSVAPCAHHRAKTHLRYRVKQTALDQYRWITPHGLVRRVDRTGTHRSDLGEACAEEVEAALERIAPIPPGGRH